jgi:hypothetical protein
LPAVLFVFRRSAADCSGLWSVRSNSCIGYCFALMPMTWSLHNSYRKPNISSKATWMNTVISSVLPSPPLPKHVCRRLRVLHTVTGAHLTGEPSVTDEWLALLICIWEVPGSNIGQGTEYPDSSIKYFPYSLQVTTASFHILTNSSFTCHPFIRRCIVLSYCKGVVK